MRTPGSAPSTSCCPTTSGALLTTSSSSRPSRSGCCSSSAGWGWKSTGPWRRRPRWEPLSARKSGRSRPKSRTVGRS
eukprot:3296436-Alexandrium_andersonii.AAC.1